MIDILEDYRIDIFYGGDISTAQKNKSSIIKNLFYWKENITVYKVIFQVEFHV